MSAESARLAEKKVMEDELMNFEVREEGRRDRTEQTLLIDKCKHGKIVMEGEGKGEGEGGGAPDIMHGRSHRGVGGGGYGCHAWP